MLSNDTAVVLLLADRQREIEGLRAEVEGLRQENAELRGALNAEREPK